jgi:hypothetical protein
MVSVGSTSKLAHTLSLRRSIRRQAIAVALLLIVAAAWRLSPLHEPEPLTLVILAIGSAVLVIELAAAWWEGEQADHYADELILTGFADTTPHTPIGCTVAHRVTRLESRHARRRLAHDLRWRVRLANGWTRLSPGYVRTSTAPPLSSAQRHLFQHERELIDGIATLIERGPVDPRALVILHRLITLPPTPEPRGHAAREADDLRHQLDTVRSLIKTPTPPSAS